MDMENKDDLIELIDEEGQTVLFEHLMTVEHEGEYYIALMTAESLADEDADEGDIVILKIAKDDNGEDCYISVDDDQTVQAVYNKFITLIEEEDDEDPDEDDEA